jgi:hypothetical protein
VPEVKLVTPAPSEVEAAAVIAAVQRFLADHAPPAETKRKPNPWLRAARLEATRRRPDDPTPWGDSIPWGPLG